MKPKNAETGARRWPVFVIVLLGFHMAVGSAMLYFATTDPSFAVEEDYYEKALAWDDTARERRASAGLGWTASLSISDDAGPLLERTVTAMLVDAEGRPVEDAAVRVVAFHNARADDRLEAAMTAAGAGLYTSALRLRRPGVWEFRLSAVRGADAYSRILREEVRPAAGPAGGAPR